jgi:hypothetical protein
LDSKKSEEKKFNIPGTLKQGKELREVIKERRKEK